MRLYDSSASEWAVSSFSAKSAVADEINKRTRKDFGFSTSEKVYNVVGMNANKIPDMITAIENWVKEMEDHIKEIDSATDQSKAFKDDAVQKAVRDYIDNVKAYCVNLISDLNAFADKLVTVRNAYQQSMGTLSSAVKATGASNETGDYYSRQFNV